jgi:hypothetical protein
MKSLTILAAVAILTVSLSSVHAQEVPKGFEKGTVTLTDGSTVSGYVKEKIRGNASVTIISETDKKKKTYDGNELLSAEIGNDKFICQKGDFFKIIHDGRLKFVQKASDASRKPIYNGNQAVFANGTEGEPGDFFIYNNNSHLLKLITRKTITAVTTECFAGCDTAIAKAKAVSGDVSELGEAVELYNNCKN